MKDQETRRQDRRKHERRRHERVELLAEVEIPHDASVDILFAQDLSAGGVFLAALPEESPWLLPGVPVDLAIGSTGDDDAGPVIRARGRVVWRQDASSGRIPGIGVAFEALDEQNLTALNRLLARREPPRDE